MRNEILFVALLFALFSCTENNTQQPHQTDSMAMVAPPVLSEKSVITKTSTRKEEDPEMYYELKYIVSVEEGYNYDSLKHAARQVASVLHYSFDSSGSYYNPVKKSMVVPENDPDEIWAGSYFLRREGDQSVSIEMRYAYLDTTIATDKLLVEQLRNDTTRLFICAGLTANKMQADSIQHALLRRFPNTKIIPAQIYMGCMH